MKWKIKYQLRDTHNVILTDDHYFHIKDVKECNVKEMIYLVKEICNASDGLKAHKAPFIAWIEENNVDGAAFIKYKKESAFCEAMMNVYPNPVIQAASEQLYKALNEYNFSALFNEKLEAEQERERTEKESQQLANALKAEQQKVAVLRQQLEKEKKTVKEIDALNDALDKQKEITRKKEERQKELENEMKQYEHEKADAEHVQSDKITQYLKETNQEMNALRDELKKYKQIAREKEERQNEQDKINTEQFKSDLAMEYEAKENILQSEVKLLEEHKLRLNKEISQMKQNEKMFMNEINDVIQSKIILIKATSSEIDALRQKIKIYWKRNEYL
eukprot:626912_1